MVNGTISKGFFQVVNKKVIQCGEIQPITPCSHPQEDFPNWPSQAHPLLFGDGWGEAVVSYPSLSSSLVQMKCWPLSWPTEGSDCIGPGCQFICIQNIIFKHLWAPIFWPPDEKNWLIGKDPDAGKDWEQEEKGTTEDEMVGWHHLLNEQEFEQTLGGSEGQGSLACCSPWGHRVGHNQGTEQQLARLGLILLQCRAKPLDRGRDAKGAEVPMCRREACSALSPVSAEYKQSVLGIGTVHTGCTQRPSRKPVSPCGLVMFSKTPWSHAADFRDTTEWPRRWKEISSESQTYSSPFPQAFSSADLPYQTMLLGGWLAG